MIKDDLKYILFGISEETGNSKKKARRKKSLIKRIRTAVGMALIRLSGRPTENYNRPQSRRNSGGRSIGVSDNSSGNRKRVNPNRRRRKRRIIKRRIQDVAIVLCVVFFAWSIFFIIKYKPFNTKYVEGKTLHGKITEELDCTGIDSEYVQSGKTYTINAKCIYTDVFHVKAEKIISSENIKVKLDDSDNGNMSINGNKISINSNTISGDSLKFTISYNDAEKTFTYQVKNKLKDLITKDKIITNPYALDAVVNKDRHLSSKFKPKDLVQPNVPFHQSSNNVKKMRKEAAAALEKLFSGANKEGYKLYAVSGFRSYALQVEVFNNNVAQYGSVQRANMYSSKPGESDHQLGLVMDITTSEVGYRLTEDFGSTDAGKWVKENCYKYGFIIRYPKRKTNITGYEYEPWHLRYVGKRLAKILYENDLTLEEYFEK